LPAVPNQPTEHDCRNNCIVAARPLIFPVDAGAPGLL
jgi:hypothetical protein